MKMNQLKTILFPILFLVSLNVSCQTKTAQLNFKISIDSKDATKVKSEGRLFLYLTKNERRSPRSISGTDKDTYVFARNIKAWKRGESIVTGANDNWTKTGDWDFKNVPEGIYNVQAVWKQNEKESGVNEAGNMYSEPVKIDLKNTQQVEISISEIIPNREIHDHALVKTFGMKSELLSKFWNKEMELKVSVLLPSSYDKNLDKKYPVRYNVAGYGGRYTRINRLFNNVEFVDWWQSDEAPQIITIFLDGSGPFGDSYQLNSDNSGPYGDALIQELIPAIEKEFRIIGTPATRFVDGCSTGGWVSLALQLIYPDDFNGCYSYSPDPVDFHKMQLINLYKDETAFYNNSNYLRPSMRNKNGDPVFSIKDEVLNENVQGNSNSYTTSGNQWGAWNALYSPKGADGLPKPVFDPVTGKIDKEVAAHWKKYDLHHYAKTNWSTLGPKIQGKIYVWMGDMDNYYLNNALRDFDVFLKNTKDPVSDAKIIFTPMEGHCSLYSHREVLEMIWEKLRN